MDMYTQLAWLIPLLPLAAFLILTALGRSFRRAAVLLGSLGALATFILSMLVFIERLDPNAIDYSNDFKWIEIGDYTLSIGFEVTNLTAIMLVIVSLVALLVNVYSAGYMKHDERLTVFYGYVSLFTFSMLGLVLSDNLLSFYIFWELMGVCSFLLIGFWYARPAAKAAAKKAFIVTRIGDAGLLLAILMLFWYMPNNALDFTTIQSVFNGQSGAFTTTITTVIALLIFLGAVGKSGQFPLHVWLPDAMEGPTPISALIHAATMVAAGVFLLARTYPILLDSAAALEVIAYVGGFTAIFAATIAIAQKDIKRILAYSTISQLGYMVMALGLKSMTSGIFHLMTHAFFKALLFLGAGCIIHAVHTQMIGEMGGLGKKMRITAWTFGIGALALSGIPPFSGFWSKDAILAAAYDENIFLFIVGLGTALLTALYMSRLFILVFLGKESSASIGAKEAPAVMTIPLMVLAALAVLSGFVQTPWNGWFGQWLTGEAEAAHGNGILVMLLSSAAAIIGLLLGWKIYSKDRAAAEVAASAQSSWYFKLLERKYYIDEIYDMAIVRPLKGMGSGLALFDEYVIGGAVRLVAGAAGAAGRLSARLQSGQVQGYSLAAVIGLIVLIVAIIGRRFWS